jgi:hypothetical protein
MANEEMDFNRNLQPRSKEELILIRESIVCSMLYRKQRTEAIPLLVLYCCNLLSAR